MRVADDGEDADATDSATATDSADTGNDDADSGMDDAATGTGGDDDMDDDGTGDICDTNTVSDEDMVVDLDLTTYATMHTPLGVGGSTWLSVQDQTTVYPAGTEVGFVLADPHDLLTLDVLAGVAITTSLGGVYAEGAGAGSPQALDLLYLGDGSGNVFVSFETLQRAAIAGRTAAARLLQDRGVVQSQGPGRPGYPPWPRGSTAARSRAGVTT